MGRLEPKRGVYYCTRRHARNRVGVTADPESKGQMCHRGIAMSQLRF
jgi:hypothetical protein